MSDAPTSHERRNLLSTEPDAAQLMVLEAGSAAGVALLVEEQLRRATASDPSPSARTLVFRDLVRATAAAEQSGGSSSGGGGGDVTLCLVARLTFLTIYNAGHPLTRLRAIPSLSVSLPHTTIHPCRFPLTVRRSLFQVKSLPYHI